MDILYLYLYSGGSSIYKYSIYTFWVYTILYQYSIFHRRLTSLSFASFDEIDDKCVVEFMLPSLKECSKLEIFSLEFNKKLSKVQTVNLLLSELPASLEYLKLVGNADGFAGAEILRRYDESLVSERKTFKNYKFDAYIF